MKPNRIAKKYAEALLIVSRELDCIPKTGNSLRIIDQLIKQEKVFRAFFYTQRIKPIEKVNILKTTLRDMVNPIVYEFFGLIAERNQYQNFLSVVVAYSKLERESLNQINVTTYSIDKINEKTISSIIESIEISTGKTVKLSTETNKNLLGGLKLRIGNTIFDGTVANQLARMKKVLLQKY